MPNYIVRTISPITTEDPLTAVDIYKTQLENTPLDSLVYRVEDIDAERMFYVYRERVYREVSEMRREVEREAREHTREVIKNAPSADPRDSSR